MKYTPVDEILRNVTLPNPTQPVPFEQFEALGNADDILHRAAFWSYYAAWLLTKEGNDTQATRARNDGNMLQYFAKEVKLEDTVMVRRSDLHLLGVRETELDQIEVSMRDKMLAVCIFAASGFVMGVVFTLALMGVFKW